MNTTSTTPATRTRRPTAAPARGFTLAELLVVITIISLLGTMIIPSIIGMFKAGAESQAYAMFAAQLSSARELAKRNSCYVCVHVQQAAPDTVTGANKGKFISAVMVRNPFNYSVSGSSGTDYSFYPDQVFAIVSISGGSGNTINAVSPAGTVWSSNQWAGYWLRVIKIATGGSGPIGQAKLIVGNTSSNGSSAASITLASAFDTVDSSGTTLPAPASGDVIMIYRPTGMDPQVLPGTIAVGKLAKPFVNDSGAVVQDEVGDATLSPDPYNTANKNVRCAQSFTTVTVIFSPSGTVVTTVPDSTGNAGGATFATVIPGTTASGTDPVYSGATTTVYKPNLPGCFFDGATTAYTPPDIKTRIWDHKNLVIAAANTTDLSKGASAVTMFDYTKFSKMTGATRAAYLGATGDAPYFSINVYTGQMLPRK